MIFSTLTGGSEIKLYPAGLRKALEYLKSTDLSALATGTYPIEGTSIYAIVQEIETKPLAQKRPEAHKEYIDIQYVLSGAEKLGFAPLESAGLLAEENPEKDLYFYQSSSLESFVVCQSGWYCVFFPWDLHRPGCEVDIPQTIRKVVVKVRIDTCLP